MRFTIDVCDSVSKPVRESAGRPRRAGMPGYSDAVSMDRMFEDLEARMAHLESQEIRATAEELGRAERSQVLLTDRLRAAAGSALRVHCGDGVLVEGQLAALGADWLLLGDSAESGRRVLVPLASVVMVEGLAPRARPSTGEVLPDRPLGSVLRSLARDRELVRVVCGGAEVPGRIAAVGRDALDLVVQPTGEQGAVPAGHAVCIPFTGIRAVRLV